MVLSKRKADGQFVEWNSSSQPSMSAQPQQVANVEEPPTKRTRANPPRSARGAKVIESASEEPVVKKARAPRGKKAAAAAAAVALQAQATPAVAQPGPSSQPAAPPQKKARGKKKAIEDEDVGAPSGSQPEKRGAIFKPLCPQNILDRVNRVMTQRIFMIDRNRTEGELKEEFSVLGSTGNVYTVTIDKKPRCNCPDAVKGNHCKHILFIFLKVLQVPRTSGVWYQKALLSTELQEVFDKAPLAPNSIAHAHIREAHARATGKLPSIPADAVPSSNKRIPGPDDDCPICYDGMHGAAEATLTFCEECGNALHKECFGQWQRTAATQGKPLTCVWCRSNWVVTAPAGMGSPAKRSLGGYLNLADVAGGGSQRDTSTYYHGPRRGQRYYGYQHYDEI